MFLFLKLKSIVKLSHLKSGDVLPYRVGRRDALICKDNGDGTLDYRVIRGGYKSEVLTASPEGLYAMCFVKVRMRVRR